MNACITVITAITAWVPKAIPLSGSGARDSTKRMASNSAWSAWMRSWEPDYGSPARRIHPREDLSPSRAEHADRLTHDPTYWVPVESETDLSGLAAKVTRAICSARAHSARPIDVVMFCHSSPEEHMSTTTAARLRAEIGAPCFPFSLSQQHGVSPFTALQLAGDLLTAEAEIHTILLVAAEKWCPPFSRRWQTGLLHGDAAGALLLERAAAHSPAGVRLLGAASWRALFDPARDASETHDASTHAWRSLIDAFIARHGLAHGDIAEMVGPRRRSSLTAAPCNLRGQPKRSAQQGMRIHLGAAEPIVRLERLLTRAPAYPSRRVLLWGDGVGGFLGAALLQMPGASHSRRLTVSARGAS